MGRKKAWITLLDKGNVSKTVKIDLYLEHDVDWTIFQQIRNHNVCFDKNSITETLFQHLWNTIKDIPYQEVLPRNKTPLGIILPTVMCGQQVPINSTEASFEYYASPGTIGMIGLCPAVRFYEEFARSYGCHIDESETGLRCSIYVRNKEVDELKVKTLGKAKYNYIIAPLLRSIKI